MGAAEDVEAYLSALPDLAQEPMRQIRAQLLAAAPRAEEQMKYGMPTARLGGVNILYYAAWKAHIGIYPVYRGDAAFEALVAGCRDKKDTLRFALSRPLPLGMITRVIEHQIARTAIG